MEPDLASPIDGDPPGTAMSGDGRFLAYSLPDQTVHVRDRFFHRHEVLTSDGGSPAGRLISDDGRVIVTGRGHYRANGPGWLEFLAEDA